MFNRYWRTYPWFLQLILFVLMVFTLTSFGTYLLLALIPKLTGVSLLDIQHISIRSSAKVARAGIITQSVAHVCTFAIPCLLFAYFTHPKPAAYLGLRPPGRPIHWVLVTGIMLGFLLVSLYLENMLQQHIKLPANLEKMQQLNNEMTQGLLHFTTVGDFLWAFISIAILAPFGEELLFRSILMRFAHKRSRSMLFPVLITALLFASVHFNPYGIPFIFMAGVLLALIYWLTGSLWCSIFAHLLYNGTQVAGAWFAGNNAAAKAAVDGDRIPLYLPVLGLIVLAASLTALVKTKTPLPPDWSGDYAPGENVA